MFLQKFPRKKKTSEKKKDIFLSLKEFKQKEKPQLASAGFEHKATALPLHHLRNC